MAVKSYLVQLMHMKKKKKPCGVPEQMQSFPVPFGISPDFQSVVHFSILQLKKKKTVSSLPSILQACDLKLWSFIYVYCSLLLMHQN